MTDSSSAALKNLYEVLQYVRVDGPIDAPISVLTIEDGGEDIQKGISHLKDRFSAMAQAAEDDSLSIAQFLNNEGKFEKKGQIGASLSKIAKGLLPSQAAPALYSPASLFCNIKFFPLSKPNMSPKAWKDQYPDLEDAGLPLWLYQQIARGLSMENRKALLRRQVNRDSVIIVAGAFEHWGPLLFEAFAKRNQIFKRSTEADGLRILHDQSDRILFYECKMIRTPIGDTACRRLVESLRGNPMIEKFLTEFPK